MHKGHFITFALLGSVAVATACGSSSPTAETPTSEATASAAAPPAPSTAAAADTAAPTATAVATASASGAPAAVPATWKDATTKEQQVAYMKTNIVPHMIKVFQGEDAKRYANFDCKTCHGPEYKAPKDFLPHLAFKGGKFAVSPDKAKVLAFMKDKVAPEMASAMGDKPFDPATHTGFGCGGCHMVDMK